MRRTDRDGTVSVTTDGSRMTVRSGRAETYRGIVRRPRLTSHPSGGGVQTSVTTIERFIVDQEHRYPEATGELSNLLYDIALAAKLIAAAIRRAGLVNILGTRRESKRPGRGAAEAGRLRQRNDEGMPQSHRPGVCDGLRGRRRHHPGSPRIPRRQVRGPLRSPRRLLQHRRQLRGRHHLQHLSPDQHGRTGDGGRRAPAGLQAGRGGLRDVRVEHDAGVHHGTGGARVHPGSHHRRVPALASPHHHAAGGEVLQREREQLLAVGQGRCRPPCGDSKATCPTGCSRRTAATSGRWSPISTGT